MNIYTHITQDMKKSEFDNLAEKLQKQWETSQPKLRPMDKAGSQQKEAGGNLEAIASGFLPPH